jgi:Putative Flp pilus-assembly TadE/G-like
VVANSNWNRRRKKPVSREAGQAILFFILVLGLFLLGALCFALDLTNLWFHRQAAQTAADAACVAGAMDLLVDAQGGATGHQGFTTGTGFDCSSVSTSAYPVCQYARFNGYDSSNGTPGNLVSVSFPGAPPGVTSPPTSVASTSIIRVDVLDRTQTFFSGLLSGSTTRNVNAFATCGVVLASAPLPLLVLDPQNPVTTPASAALNVQGTPTIKIIGGPSQSIQVNSFRNASSCGQSNCANNLPWGTASIDLSHGGPNGTGSDMGLYGGPVNAPSGFVPGSTGHWVSPSAPISDPFAQVCAPGQSGCPSINGNTPPAAPTSAPQVPSDLTSVCSSIPCHVAYHVHGCPDGRTGPNGGCDLYEPGLYTSQINIHGSGGITAIFDPGIYYLKGGLNLASGSLVRPGTGPSYTGAPGGSDGGTFLYFSDATSSTATVTVDSSSGSRTTSIDDFSTTTGPATTSSTSAYSFGVGCASGSSIPTNLPSTLSGNILLGMCTGYYGDPLGTSDPLGVQRGFLFFQDRAGQSVQPSWNGGGMFLLAGTMYFHSCNSTGTGTGCGAAGTYYNDVFSLQGNSGSNTYVLGSIVTDNLTLGGTSIINMDLNPNVTYNLLKASLLQ